MGRPVTILFLGANPSSTTRLRLDKEVHEIDERLRAAEHRDAFEIKQAWAVRPKDLQKCFLRYKPAIVHFGGHGLPDDETEEIAGALVLEDETGEAKPVPPPALADLFRILGGTMRGVVLNACYTEVQARAIAEHVDVVVGMSSAVDDKTAIAFAGGFYEGLGYGHDVQKAFELGRSRIRLEGLPDADVPKLIAQAGVDPRAVRLADAGPPSSKAKARAPGSALHQLRAPPADFTGRGDELADLRARLGAGGAIIAGLTGQGGVGKTALALRLAQELRTSYPDAQIDLDLRGVDPKPLEPAQVMAEVIRAFDPEMKLPEGLDAMGGLYRSVLDGKRALLFFDNARDRAQVEPLAPPPGCLMLVTSRQHFTLPGIYTRRLDTLAEVDAVALVRSIVPRLDEVSAHELANICAHLPLALRAAASVLAERVDMKPVRYIERLRGAERAKLLETVLAESLALIVEPVRDFWLRLGIMPADFDAPTAAAVGDVEEGHGEEHLGELVRRSLLDWDEAAERYRMHDIARDYARSRLAPTERYATERRHAEYFVEVVRAAENQYIKGGVCQIEALHAFNAASLHIAAAQAWAAVHAEHDNAAAVVCYKLPLLAPHLLNRSLYPREKLAWLESARVAARHLGERADEGGVLGDIGLAYADLGETKKAIQIFEQALAIARELGDRRSECMTLGDIGRAYQSMGKTKKASEFFNQYLAIARALVGRRHNDPRLDTVLASNKFDDYPGFRLALREEMLARKAVRMDHFEVLNTVEFYEQMLTEKRESGDWVSEARALRRLGAAYLNVGKPYKAIEFYTQLIELSLAAGSRYAAAMVSWDLGLVYEELGRLKRAVDLMQVLVDFERENGYSDLAHHEAYLAQVRARLGE